MKLDLLSAQKLPARAIYDFQDAQGYKRTLIVHPNEHLTIWTEHGSIRLDTKMAKSFIALLTQFVDTGDVDPASVYEEAPNMAEAIRSVQDELVPDWRKVQYGPTDRNTSVSDEGNIINFPHRK